MLFSITINEAQDGWLVRMLTPEGKLMRLAECRYLWVAEVLVGALKEQDLEDKPAAGPTTTTAT